MKWKYIYIGSQRFLCNCIVRRLLMQFSHSLLRLFLCISVLFSLAMHTCVQTFDAGAQPIRAICIGWKHILIPSKSIYMGHYSLNLVWLLRDGAAENGIARRFCCCTDCAIHSLLFFLEKCCSFLLSDNASQFSFNHNQISHSALGAILQKTSLALNPISVCFQTSLPLHFPRWGFAAEIERKIAFCINQSGKYPITGRIEFSSSELCLWKVVAMRSSFMATQILPSESTQIETWY